MGLARGRSCTTRHGPIILELVPVAPALHRCSGPSRQHFLATTRTSVQHRTVPSRLVLSCLAFASCCVGSRRAPRGGHPPISGFFCSGSGGSRLSAWLALRRRPSH